MTGSWTQSLCSSVRIQIHDLSGYILLQIWSYSFNILQDVYTHNGGVHVHRILMVRIGASFVSYRHTSFFKNHSQQNNFVHNYQVRGHTSFVFFFLFFFFFNLYPIHSFSFCNNIGSDQYFSSYNLIISHLFQTDY